MTYCYRCPDCGAELESSTHIDEGDLAIHCTFPLVRDYRREAVGIGHGVRVSRDGTLADQARVFLPSNKDFAGPGDPDGTKGMRRWHERFQPDPSNPRPVKVGEIEKRVF